MPLFCAPISGLERASCEALDCRFWSSIIWVRRELLDVDSIELIRANMVFLLSMVYLLWTFFWTVRCTLVLFSSGF